MKKKLLSFQGSNMFGFYQTFKYFGFKLFILSCDSAESPPDAATAWSRSPVSSSTAGLAEH